MQLFYVPLLTFPLCTLPAEESAHIVRVMRMKAGDELQITDGRGNMHRARIVTPDPKGCVAEIVDTLSNYRPLPYDLTIGVAPTKNIDRYEWFLEKATEVGIGKIIPLECDRSERRTVKRDRSVKVVAEAMKQSQKAFLPQVDEMTAFAKVVREPFDGIKLIAHCDRARGERLWIGDCLKPEVPVMALIGPEGDFSPSEIDMAVANGFKEITLGDQRLRTETAALAAVTALHFFSYGK